MKSLAEELAEKHEITPSDIGHEGGEAAIDEAIERCAQEAEVGLDVVRRLEAKYQDDPAWQDEAIFMQFNAERKRIEYIGARIRALKSVRP